MNKRLWAALLITMTLMSHAAVRIGDHGHYVMAQPFIQVLNPDGREWTFQLHRYQWWIGEGAWNTPDIRIHITNPEGAVIFDEAVVTPVDSDIITVPAGPKGVYQIFGSSAGGNLNFWALTASLDHAVLDLSIKKEERLDFRLPQFCPFVPRMWSFWVPPGTERFKLRAYNFHGRSHREDHGLTVYSPRGQRMGALWGQANPTGCLEGEFLDKKFPMQELDIIVENGTAGRFWTIEVAMGDSHNYSDINFTFDGIPPYIAQIPEWWFNPETGEVPSIPQYDETEFIQSNLTPEKKLPGGIEHWTPCPSFVDPDANELPCPQTIALWNPEGRELQLVIGTYLPRGIQNEDGTWRNGAAVKSEADLDHARVNIATEKKDTLFDDRIPLYQLHGQKDPKFTHTLNYKGVITLNVNEAEHFWGYTYPAVPTVLVGVKGQRVGVRSDIASLIGQLLTMEVTTATQKAQCEQAEKMSNQELATAFRVLTGDASLEPLLDAKQKLEIDLGVTKRAGSNPTHPEVVRLSSILTEVNIKIEERVTMARKIMLLQYERAEQDMNLVATRLKELQEKERHLPDGTSFTLECGTARNWYFFVPKGTKQFGIGFSTNRPEDIADFRVESGDRIMAATVANKGEFTIDVPETLDGTIWNFRCNWGGPSVFKLDPTRPRFPSMNLTVGLSGVPPYLAPTREQYFNPEKESGN